MKNVEIKIRGNKLLISIDLSQEHGLSRSKRSRVVASTEGNIPLVDSGGYRDEILNLNLTRKVGRAGTG